jgi:hypothetical protein
MKTEKSSAWFIDRFAWQLRPGAATNRGETFGLVRVQHAASPGRGRRRPSPGLGRMMVA